MDKRMFLQDDQDLLELPSHPHSENDIQDLESQATGAYNSLEPITRQEPNPIYSSNDNQRMTQEYLESGLGSTLLREGGGPQEQTHLPLLPPFRNLQGGIPAASGPLVEQGFRLSNEHGLQSNKNLDIGFDGPRRPSQIEEDGRSHNKKTKKKKKNQAKQPIQENNLSIETMEYIMSSKKLDRMETTLDKASIFNQTQITRTAAENKKKFMDNFGISFKIPALYCQDAKIYPQDPKYTLQLVRYVTPHTFEYQVVTHDLSGKFRKEFYGDLHQEYQNCSILRLLMRDQQTLICQDEVRIQEQYCQFQFSVDGTLCALFMPTLKIIRIIKVDECCVQSFLDQIRECEEDNNCSFIQYDWVDRREELGGLDLGFVSKIEFDTNCRYFIAYGGCNVFILDLETAKGNIYSVDKRQFEQVNDLQLKARPGEMFQCFVACKRKNIKQVSYFDLMEEVNRVKKNQQNFKKKKGNQQLQSLMTINFQNEPQPNFKVMISDDFLSVVLTNGKENCLIERQNGYYTQRILYQLKSKIVCHIDQDGEGGFYFLASKEYDRYLSCEHSRRDDIQVRFERDIQPGIIQIFDFHIMDSIDQTTLTTNQVRKEIRILSVKDDEFLFDKAIFTEENVVRSCHSESIEQNNINERIYNSNCIQKDIEYFYYVYNPIRAFSINWPYVAFAGLGNYLMIVNSFDRRLMRRIQIAEDDKKIMICETYITDTYDLFIVVNEDNIYKVYQIDLDQSNLSEHNDYSNFDFSIQYQIQLIYQYTAEDVNNSQMQQFHVRGSSRKEIIDLNKKLQMFFRHGNNLYYWIQQRDHIKNNIVFEQIQRICYTTSKLYEYSDEIFYFTKIKKNEKNEIVSQDITKIKSNFSNFDIKVCFEEKNASDRIKAFNIDQATNQLIILYKRLQKNRSIQKNDFFLKIFDIGKGITIYELQIENPLLIGRLKSGLYTFVGGHIYYNNNVIKIRYDLINRPDNGIFKEDEIFDQYLTIFSIKENEQVKADTPLDSIRGHRFGYIISDKDHEQPKELLILPYLHERKIFLNRIKTNDEYFYTSTETVVSDEIKYHHQIMQQFSEMSGIDMNDLIEDEKNPMAIKKLRESDSVSKSNQAKANLLSTTKANNIGQKALELGNKKGGKPKQPVIKSFKALSDDLRRKISLGLIKQNPNSTFTSIICMKQMSKKFYVYSQNGLLINRVNFSQEVDQYGSPVSTSNSGLAYIFRKSPMQMEDLKDQRYTDEQLQREFMTVNILEITVFGLRFIKSINLLDRISSYVKEQPNSSMQGGSNGLLSAANIRTKDFSESVFMRENHWLIDSDYSTMTENLKMSFQINDQMDIMIRFRHKDDVINIQTESDENAEVNEPSVFNEEDGTTQNNTIYYFENKSLRSPVEKLIFPQNDDNIVKVQNMYQTLKHRETEFTMNSQFFFTWDRKNVYYFNLNQKFCDEKQKRITLDIEYDDTDSVIKDIRCGSEPSTIVIIVRQSRDVDSLLIWDVIQDCEIEQYDIEENYSVIWDKEGKPYIITENKVYFPMERCAMKAFENNDFLSEETTTNLQTHNLNIQQGHRFDGKNHNWLIFKEYLKLPFSYMTFVIKDKIEKNDPSQIGNLFDIEPYNYLFNKSTCFIDSEFVKNDHAQLSNVLENFQMIDPEYLEILQYPQLITPGDNKKTFCYTVLHKAHEASNNKNVELILAYLSKIKQDASLNFISIFDKMIDYKNFTNLLNHMAVQSKQMQKKQSLKIAPSQVLNDNILVMTDTIHQYVDDKFFTEKLGDQKDDEELASFPINVVGLKIGWVIDETLSNDQNSPYGLMFLKEILKSGNLDLFKIPCLQIMIEFLYQKYKYILLSVMLPLYIASHLTFEFQTHQNSYINTKLWARRLDVFVECDSIDALTFDLMQLPEGYKMFNVTGGHHNMIYDSKLYSMRSDGAVPDTYIYDEGGIKDLKDGPERLLAQAAPQRESLTHLITLKDENFPLSEDFFKESSKYCMEELIQCKGFHGAEEDESLFKINLVCNMIMVIFQFLQMLIVMKYMRTDYFFRFYSWVDLTYVIMNFYIYKSIFDRYDRNMFKSQWVDHIQFERHLEVFAVITIYGKSTYFLSMVDSIAPLIDMILQILVDIKYFLFVVLIYVIAFGTCFYILGQNQQNFDNIDNEKLDTIDYFTTAGSFWYVFKLIVGSTDFTGMELGDQNEKIFLYVIFIACAFVIYVHFLNMLIAIMGQTQGSRSQVSAQVMIKDHLRFVMDNRFLMDLALTNKKRVKNIICAFNSDNVDLDHSGNQDDQYGDSSVNSNLGELKKTVLHEFKKGREQSRDTQIMIGLLLKKHTEIFKAQNELNVDLE